MYLTAGIIAAQKAGPGGILSIVLAGLGSVLTGVHYAELAGICPHTSGSAYMYTYVTVGELSAFVIGWGLIVEYVIGTAAASVALSETFHSITEHAISNFIHTCTSAVGLPSIDVIAALVCLLLMWLLATGVKMSARFNNILNCINFIIWAIFVGASLYLGSSSNWSEHGGFLPFGPLGVLSAIPTAFYAFIGFDGLSTTGAECISPIKSIPVSIVLSIFINIVIFVMVVMGLTFSLPYK
nr:cationic amino acid transporter 3 [Biomphalaria glabrata]